MSEFSDRTVAVFRTLHKHIQSLLQNGVDKNTAKKQGVVLTSEEYDISESTVRKYDRQVRNSGKDLDPYVGHLEDEYVFHYLYSFVNPYGEDTYEEEGFDEIVDKSTQDLTLDDQDRFNSYDEKNEKYIFHIPGETLIISKEKFRQMKADYSEDLGRQTALGIQELCGKYDITRRMFSYIKQVRNWVHKSSMWLKEDFDTNDPESLADKTLKTYEGKEGYYQKKLEKKRREKKEKLAEEAEEDLWLLKRAMDLMNASAPHLEYIPPQHKPYIESSKSLVVTLSDFHEQMRVWGEEMLTDMGYDAGIRQQIVDTYIAEVLEEIDKRNYKLKEARFWENGDSIDGLYHETVSGTPRLNQDTGNMEAILNLMNIYVSIIKALYDKVGRVVVDYVPGNHEGFIQHVLFMWLEQFFQNYDDIVINTHYKNVKEIIIGQNQFLLFHGKMPGFGRSLPDKPSSKWESQIQKLFMLYKSGYSKTRNHYIITGHLHAFRDIDTGMFEEIRLPSPAPNDEYADSGLWFHRPSNVMLIIDEYEGVENIRRFYFDDERK